jgi:hypothetical protein
MLGAVSAADAQDVRRKLRFRHVSIKRYRSETIHPTVLLYEPHSAYNQNQLLGE